MVCLNERSSLEEPTRRFTLLLSPPPPPFLSSSLSLSLSLSFQKWGIGAPHQSKVPLPQGTVIRRTSLAAKCARASALRHFSVLSVRKCYYVLAGRLSRGPALEVCLETSQG